MSQRLTPGSLRMAEHAMNLDTNGLEQSNRNPPPEDCRQKLGLEHSSCHHGVAPISEQHVEQFEMWPRTWPAARHSRISSIDCNAHSRRCCSVPVLAPSSASADRLRRLPREWPPMRPGLLRRPQGVAGFCGARSACAEKPGSETGASAAISRMQASQAPLCGWAAC